jgi:AcrR family transcriptional regulator
VTPARLTRKEKQARTRSSLMRSAARIFCKHGLDRTSIDEVAEDAGYTKGAFYANFRSKQELFLAMLDERFTQRIEEVDRAFSDEGSPPQQARQAAADYARAFRADPGAERLFFEFASYALRDDDFRQELLTRFATLRDRLERVYQRRIDEYGLELDIPTERIVRMVIAMADGWALWQLLDPEGVDEDLLETMIEIFTTGVGALGGAGELAARQAPASPRPA